MLLSYATVDFFYSMTGCWYANMSPSDKKSVWGLRWPLRPVGLLFYKNLIYIFFCWQYIKSIKWWDKDWLFICQNTALQDSFVAWCYNKILCLYAEFKKNVWRHTMSLVLNLCFSIECEAGFYGPNCIIPCRYPNYGRECQEKCHCKENACNFVTGCFMYGEKSHLTIHQSMHTYTYCIFTNSSSLIQRQLHLHHMTFSDTREIATCPIYMKCKFHASLPAIFHLKFMCYHLQVKFTWKFTCEIHVNTTFIVIFK